MCAKVCYQELGKAIEWEIYPSCNAWPTEILSWVSRRLISAFECQDTACTGMMYLEFKVVRYESDDSEAIRGLPSDPPLVIDDRSTSGYLNVRESRLNDTKEYMIIGLKTPPHLASMKKQ